jgi:hypothetical protein
MGRSPVPPPDPAFVDRLASRLRSVPIAYELEEASPRRALVLTPARAAMAMTAIAAAVIVVLALVTQPHDGVTSIGPADAPTTTAAPVTTTSFTIPPDPWTVPTTAPAEGFLVAPTTTAKGRAVAPGTTTTGPPRETRTPPPTRATSTTAPTSTTRPPPERLSLTCRPMVREGRNGIACEWSQSSRPAFASYQLMKATGSNAPRVVFTTRDRAGTRFFDGDVAAGGSYSYAVKALDAEGRVIGEGTRVTTTCC